MKTRIWTIEYFNPYISNGEMQTIPNCLMYNWLNMYLKMLIILLLTSVIFRGPMSFMTAIRVWYVWKNHFSQENGTIRENISDFCTFLEVIIINWKLTLPSLFHQLRLLYCLVFCLCSVICPTVCSRGFLPERRRNLELSLFSSPASPVLKYWWKVVSNIKS